jgi:large subunit ribosomal protein L25
MVALGRAAAALATRSTEMETTKLQAEVRASRGKGPARRLRAEGKVPAVVYGPGVSPTALSVSPKDLAKALGGEHGRNVVFSLSFDGKDLLAMVRDLAVDPVTRQILHADFYRVTEDLEVNVVVPVTTHGRAVGVQRGGSLKVSFRELPVRTRPGLIPVSVHIDVSKLDIGQTITIAGLDLPEGVIVTLPPKQAVVTVLAESKAKPEEEGAAAAG